MYFMYIVVKLEWRVVAAGEGDFTYGIEVRERIFAFLSRVDTAVQQHALAFELYQVAGAPHLVAATERDELEFRRLRMEGAHGLSAALRAISSSAFHLSKFSC